MKWSTGMFALWVSAGGAGVAGNQEKDGHLNALHGIYFDEDCLAASDGGACRGELSENENHAKEKLSSGLIARDVRLVTDFDSRSIHPKRGHIFRDDRLYFNSISGTARNAG